MTDKRSPSGVLKWDIAEMARVMNISQDDVREYFTDGRRVSFLLERRLSREVFKGKLAPSEGAGYDLMDREGRKWEVRSISRGGIYFCPSYMVGSGRSFKKTGFLNKLSETEVYIVSDIECSPEVPYWIISADKVLKWWNLGELGTNTKTTREKALAILSQ
jgi:hypothetical protein